jgi:ATP-dependent helicase HrpA
MQTDQKEQLIALERGLELCLVRDRQLLQRRLQGLRHRRRRGLPVEQALPRLTAALEASLAEAQRRRALVPPIRYPEELPVAARRQDIAETLAGHQVIVICGETGSGKTTQLPKLCLELGRGARGSIAHTQPRRIAARSVAARIAEELGQPLGGLVGYRVRFGDRVGPDTCVKLLTDGMLLAEIQQDRDLLAYDTLIIDEAHERSLNIDFLLGYLHRLLPRRPDLKLIITSATIDPEGFARHFGAAPIINVSGRSYPVELRYRPLAGRDEDERDRSRDEGIVDAVAELAAEGPGDILVFLPGEREIREVAEALRKHHPPGTEVLPLFARLSAREQQRVFQTHTGRRIVLATNVAETSLTVPGIRYVVDLGFARISRYSVRSKVQRLPIEPISRASADQRAGRCGRTGPGICVRLYDEQDYQAREAYTDPEILRTNLASVILQMVHLELGAIEEFPFLEPPDSRQISDGYRLLLELGAVDEARRVTALGHDIARFPVDPRLARMLIAARDGGALREVLLLVSVLSLQDPRDRPLEARAAADQRHARFTDPRSDFMGLLKLWDYFQERARHLSGSKLRQLCREEYLSWVRMREWSDVHRQLRALVAELGYRVNEEPAGYASLHQALLSGLIGHVGLKHHDGGYSGARGRRFLVFPGSALAKKGPRWVMAAELVETSRLFARTVARVEVTWIERAAAHLLSHSYGEPRWDQDSGRVVADETVSLYGLTLVPRRPVDYGGIDCVEARRIFLREALVHGHYRPQAPFLEHNRQRVEEVECYEAKARRRDLLVEEAELLSFYDQRIPAEVWDSVRFERWRRSAERHDPRCLYLTRADLLRRDPAEVTAGRYPEQLRVGALELPLSYRFEPGDRRDGITALIPAPVLKQLPEAEFQWLVPGLLEEKVTAMIRSLPKVLRRHFVPAPDFARACVQRLQSGSRPLGAAVAEALGDMTGVPVPAEAWQFTALPEHLQMNFRVVDELGEVLDEGRDLAALQRTLSGVASESFSQLPSSELERGGMRAWDFEVLPERVELRRGALRLSAYPGLVDEGESVAVRVHMTPEEASAAHLGGVRRLLRLGSGGRVDALARRLPDLQALCLRYSTVGRCEALRQDLMTTIVDRAFLDAAPLPRNRQAFDSALERGLARLESVAGEVCALCETVLAGYQPLRKALKSASSLALASALADLQSQLENLIYPGFMVLTPWPRLQQLPRYLQAMALRLERLQRDPGRDRERAARVLPLWRACLERLQAQRVAGLRDEALERYRWLLEEYRVSCFAQDLGTAEPVSEKRLAELWAAIS